MIRLALAGATGRMGRSVLELAVEDEGFEIAAALIPAGASRVESALRIGQREILLTDRLDAECDVLVDFTLPSGTMAWMEVCRQRGLPMVIGVTGHSEQQLSGIREAARTIPIVTAPNFSPGLQVILGLIGALAKKLGNTYDVEIVETHHRGKIDAPSGTALALVEAIAGARGRPPGEGVVFGRHGQVGPRPEGQIGVHALRMGDLVSQHEVHLAGPGETISIRHAVHSRTPYAAGALRAASWIVSKPPGLYSMREVMSNP